MPDKVLCKDCKHAFRPWDSWLLIASSQYAWKCRLALKDAEVEHNPVIGLVTHPPKYESCNLSRFRGAPCGPEGKLWEPKDPKKFFTYLKRI